MKELLDFMLIKTTEDCADRLKKEEDLSKIDEGVIAPMVQANYLLNPSFIKVLTVLNDLIMKDIGHEYVEFFLNTIVEKYELNELTFKKEE